MLTVGGGLGSRQELGETPLQAIELSLLSGRFVECRGPGLVHSCDRGPAGLLLLGQRGGRGAHLAALGPVLVDRVLEVAGGQAGVLGAHRGVARRSVQGLFNGRRQTGEASDVADQRLPPQSNLGARQLGLQLPQLGLLRADLLGESRGPNAGLGISDGQPPDPPGAGDHGCLGGADLVACGTDLVGACRTRRRDLPARGRG
jgi:hypothetical protein